jgi:predicted DNA-binding transcriptional regulator AlpA
MSLPELTPQKLLATATPWLLLGICRSQWWKLHGAGKTPLPVYLGSKRPVWLISELESWLAHGAPDRQTWLRMQGGRP